jgi:predicted nucleic acid-binding protein
MIAATAQLCGLTVLHVDKDFELISKATGVQVEKLKIKQ